MENVIKVTPELPVPDSPRTGKGKMKVKKADRAMDNMFRIVIGNHLQLSAMADNKANMVITVCSLILSLTLWRLQDPWLRPTIICMALTCVITILFAVFATMPKLPPRLTGKVDVRGPGFNLIFFGYFSQLDFDTFRREMELVINDRSRVYESLSKDLYDLGLVLSKRKYRYVRISYQVFLVGLILSFVILTYSTLRVE